MKKYVKRLSVCVAICVSMLMVSCEEPSGSSPNITEEQKDSATSKLDMGEVAAQFENELVQADEITLKKEVLTFNTRYVILADDREIGKIEGKFINMTGDVFTLTDAKGNVIASERQIKRWGVKLNRLAEVSDWNKTVTGYIGEEVIKDFFNFGRVMHFYDKNKTEIAVCKQKVLNLLDTFEVSDMEGDKLYEIDRNISFLGSKFTITPKKTDGPIKATDVVFVTAILNEIIESENSKG